MLGVGVGVQSGARVLQPVVDRHQVDVRDREEVEAVVEDPLDPLDALGLELVHDQADGRDRDGE